MDYWFTIMVVATNIFDTLNKYANLLLVIMTAIYAYFTYLMISTMKYQFTSDIKLGNKKLGSYLMEDWFKERLKKHPDQLKNSVLRFKLCFDIFNKKPGNGSISKPTLIIKLSDGYKTRLEPRTKEHNEERIDENTTRSWEDDLGNTIFIRGGELLNIELEYEKYKLSEELIKHLVEFNENIEYTIEYLDNQGNKYNLKLNDIKSFDSVGRR